MIVFVYVDKYLILLHSCHNDVAVYRIISEIHRYSVWLANWPWQLWICVPRQMEREECCIKAHKYSSGC